jgi:hypothetical protein
VLSKEQRIALRREAREIYREFNALQGNSPEVVARRKELMKRYAQINRTIEEERKRVQAEFEAIPVKLAGLIGNSPEEQAKRAELMARYEELHELLDKKPKPFDAGEAGAVQPEVQVPASERATVIASVADLQEAGLDTAAAVEKRDDFEVDQIMSFEDLMSGETVAEPAPLPPIGSGKVPPAQRRVFVTPPPSSIAPVSSELAASASQAEEDLRPVPPVQRRVFVTPPPSSIAPVSPELASSAPQAEEEVALPEFGTNAASMEDVSGLGALPEEIAGSGKAPIPPLSDFEEQPRAVEATSSKEDGAYGLASMDLQTLLDSDADFADNEKKGTDAVSLPEELPDLSDFGDWNEEQEFKAGHVHVGEQLNAPKRPEAAKPMGRETMMRKAEFSALDQDTGDEGWVLPALNEEGGVAGAPDYSKDPLLNITSVGGESGIVRARKDVPFPEEQGRKAAE